MMKDNQTRRKVMCSFLIQLIEYATIIMAVCLLFAHGQTTKVTDHVESSKTTGERNDKSEKVVLQLDYHCMADVVARLRREHGSRICFEEWDFEMEQGRITYAQRIASLEAEAAKRKLSHRESEALEFARGRVQRGISASTPVDMDYEHYSGRFTHETIEGVLDKITAGSRYRWKSRNGTVVVSPRHKSVLDFPVTLSVCGKPLGDVVRELLGQSPEQRKISRATMHIGLGPQLHPEERVVASLNLKGIRAQDALCRAVESVGNDVVWTVLGFKGRRLLYLQVIPPKRTTEKKTDRTPDEQQKKPTTVP